MWLPVVLGVGCTLSYEPFEPREATTGARADAARPVTGASADAGVSRRRESPGGESAASRLDAGAIASELPIPSFDAGPDVGTVKSDAAANIDTAFDAGSIIDAEPAGECGNGEARGPNDHCYVALATLLSWADARERCLLHGGGWDLASIHDEATQRFLLGLYVGESWIGATDAAGEGDWLWVADASLFWVGTGALGTAVNAAYVNWSGVEPNGGGGSNCGRAVPAEGGKWGDFDCRSRRASICEGPR